MNNYPFIPDCAIENFDDDILGRRIFSKQLKDSLSKWDKKDSLIVALRGSWGEGKTSVLNLMKKEFEEDKENNNPTIIEFNPWTYSNKNNISFQFYKHISDKLEYECNNDKDRKIAKKLKLFVDLMNLTSEKKVINNLSTNILLLLGISGIAGSQLLNYLNHDIPWLKITLLVGSTFLILLELCKLIINKVLTVINYKTEESKVSSQQLKLELSGELTSRGRKILVIIDDLDRLTSDEIFEVFKLIKLNADFPNTIYLLAFDNKIVTSILQEAKKISGIEYLKKIIQIEFDLPHVNQGKINKYLFTQLDKVVLKLPDSGERFFGENNSTHWVNLFHSGYKDFFKNIRDVKRYYNSLLFNINFLVKKNSYEVNPVDFFCLEAIRVFTPELYQYIKGRKILYTDIVNSDDLLGMRGKTPIEQRKLELDLAFEKVDEQYKVPMRKLLVFLFPQIEASLDGNGKNHFAAHTISNWKFNMRICSNLFFDAYFTLIPGGNDGELTQYEIDKVIESISDENLLKNLLTDLIENRKINSFLSRFQDFIMDVQLFDNAKKANMITALFDISDRLVDDKNRESTAMDLEIARILYSFLISNDKEENYAILYDSIEKTTGIYGPIYFVASQSTEGVESVIPETKLNELKKLVIQKANFNKPEVILSNHYFLFILYRYKEWATAIQFNHFIDSIKRDYSLFLQFCNYFVSTTTSTIPGKLTVQKQKGFNLKEIGNFLSVYEIKEQIELIQKKEDVLSDEFKEIIILLNTAIDDFTKNQPDRRVALLL